METHEFEFNSTIRSEKLPRMAARGQKTVKALCGRRVPIQSVSPWFPMPTCVGCRDYIEHLLALEIAAG